MFCLERTALLYLHPNGAGFKRNYQKILSAWIKRPEIFTTIPLGKSRIPLNKNGGNIYFCYYHLKG
jgi:hypothetical protein